MPVPRPVTTTISRVSWRRLRILFAVVALAAVCTAAAGIVRLSGEIGRPFGGFAWAKGWQDRYWVYGITPHHWPGPAGGVLPLDVILAVDGRPPSAMPAAFDRPAGTPVTYQIERRGQRFAVMIPTELFSAAMLWELLGALVLCSLSAILAAQALLWRTRDRAVVLIAAFLLVAGMIGLGKVPSPRISAEYDIFLFQNLLSAFGFPLAGAVLWHFTLVFPQPQSVLARHPRAIYGPYALALGLGTLCAITNPPVELARRLEAIVFPGALSFAGSGLVASVAGGALVYWSAAQAADQVAVYKARRLALAWIGGLFLFGSFGIAIHVAAGDMPMLTELLLSMMILYPVLLVYAVVNVQQVEELRRQVKAIETMRNELHELRMAREQALHQVADDLHAYVLPDIRGLQMSVQAALHYGKGPDGEYIAGSLDKVYRTARRIMEGAKPVDLHEDQLAPSVERMLAGLEATLPGLTTELDCETWGEACPLPLKEEFYRIIQTAVTNVRDHSQARRLVVTLRSDGECVFASVRDDGRGFDVNAALRSGRGDGRYRMGVREIMARAQALGGFALVESDRGGTRVSVTVPLATSRFQTLASAGDAPPEGEG